MGFDKVVTPLAGRAPLERIAGALREREAIVVVPSRLADTAAGLAPGARVAINDDAHLGMTHSLRTALRLIEPERDFGVLLADMPALTSATIDRTEALFLQSDAEVAYPVDADGLPGHPVLFSSRARAIIDALPAADALRSARDNPSLRRVTWMCEDGGAFHDLDEPGQWEAFTGA